MRVIMKIKRFRMPIGNHIMMNGKPMATIAIGRGGVITPIVITAKTIIDIYSFNSIQTNPFYSILFHYIPLYSIIFH
jgi:hypothetical protein